MLLLDLNHQEEMFVSIFSLQTALCCEVLLLTGNLGATGEETKSTVYKPQPFPLLQNWRPFIHGHI